MSSFPHSQATHEATAFLAFLLGRLSWTSPVDQNIINHHRQGLLASFDITLVINNNISQLPTDLQPNLAVHIIIMVSIIISHANHSSIHQSSSLAGTRTRNGVRQVSKCVVSCRRYILQYRSMSPCDMPTCPAHDHLYATLRVCA